MQTSVNLQEPLTYSIIPLIFAIVIVLFGIYQFWRLKFKTEVKKDVVKAIPEKNKKNIPIIKGKYLDELDSIEYKFSNNKIELRKAYQLVSQAVRMFVFEVTDITTQNYSLSEIKKLNIPTLYELIEEYYEPEFASKSIGDFSNSINKARRIIKQWK